MKTIAEITEAIRERESFGYKASTYQMIDDVLVRVSNHIPKIWNIQNNNEGQDKFFFIFAESDVTEQEVNDFIESEMSDYDVDFVIIDDSYDFTIEDIIKMINRL